MRIFYTVLYLLVIILGVTFAALNSKLVEINLYVTSYHLPLSVLMIIVIGIGILIGMLIFLKRYLHLKSEFRHLNQQLKLTEREIKNLRSIPLQDQH